MAKAKPQNPLISDETKKALDASLLQLHRLLAHLNQVEACGAADCSAYRATAQLLSEQIQATLKYLYYNEPAPMKTE